MASKPNQMNKEEFHCALCHLWVRDHFRKPCYHGTPHCRLCLQEAACPGTWQASCPQVSALTAALGAAGSRKKEVCSSQAPLQAEPVCRSHQQRHQLVLIRKVFGGFNLFCFPDVDSRPAKRGLQKKKRKKAMCSKIRHSAGETAAFQTPRSEATVGLNEVWLQQTLSAKEGVVPASPGPCG